MVGSDWGFRMLKGTHHTPATRERLRAINKANRARLRARRLIAPSEVLEVERNGTIADKLRPFAIQAAQEPHDVAVDLGGVDACSAQVRVLLSDLGRLGLVVRVLVARFLQGDGDPELASKIGTLAGQRRSTLQALGLERREQDVDLRAYLAQQTAPNGAGAMNGAGPAVVDGH